MTVYKSILENETEKLERAIRKMEQEINEDGQPEGTAQLKRVQAFKLDFVNELMENADDPVQLRAMVTEKKQMADATQHDALKPQDAGYSADDWWVTDEVRDYVQSLSRDMGLFEVRED